MPTIETSIWLALKGRVQTLVLTPALPVAWPNESFSPPSSGYLRVTWSPNRTERRAVGSSGTPIRPSLLQIDVMAKKDRDVSVALEIAGQVAAHFPADLRVTAHGISCRVVRAPDIAQPLSGEGDVFLMIPVTISIEALA